MAAKLLFLTLVSFCAMNDLEANIQYEAFLKTVTFFEAWQECITRGRWLATIESQNEQLLVEEAMSKTSNDKAVYFIGGTDLGKKGRWAWLECSQLFSSSNFSNFYPGEPNNLGGNQRCLSIGNWGGANRGKWDDTECDKPLNGYICAFDPYISWMESNGWELIYRC